MNLVDFKNSLTLTQPPEGVSIPLQALWQDAKADWAAAHDLVNELDLPKASWVHAYLHRKEGDISNAGYWYRRAGKKMPDYSLQKEWEEITLALLAQ
ncbi:MAG: hypothetical protein JST58_15480 [Bacteroidetes bacterium]|nr:hypothetical protein [Bacteroidota bacterium]